MSGDLSLRRALTQRRVDASKGVRQLTPSGSAVPLRSLIPPGPLDGGAGGSEPAFWDAGYIGFDMVETKTATHHLCAGVQLKQWTMGNYAPPLNIENGPLEVGDLYWVGVRVTFPDTLTHFLAPYDFTSPGLANQDFRFELTLLLPGGTGLDPTNAVQWRIVPINKGQPPLPGEEPAPVYQTLTPTSSHQPPPASAWECRLWDCSSPAAGSPPALRRGQMLDVLACLHSTQPFALEQLGLRVRSQVGWAPGFRIPGSFLEGDVISPELWKQVFCRGCQRIVLLHPPYTTCAICCATGSMLIRPVEPEWAQLSWPFGW